MTDREPCACGKPTALGKWRCDDCQTRVTSKPALHLVTLPGRDADAEARARHPSNVNHPTNVERPRDEQSYP